ncbi:LysR family transcriptional regulator [Streptomyces sp. NBC_01239]|uniref:LysR family transcriptional regulator n=1 Tax=Streptomyces sp. NBC_01239 TaxID=2903792 RepID=UPI00225BDE28|nr:LysR family transcriptional regulator [Streptomyces sp. NBC_01239]MCX4817467.1 LysR family transcriptional regulator [Streptomyces sp. NBC_01239]
MYNLRRLEVLRELKYRGTLAAVATALSYSPSAVSQQLTLLESEVGAPLLEREGRGVRLSPQAEILVARTEKALRELERAETEIAASLREVSGTLRVAAFQTAMLALLPAALTWLREHHPRVRVEATQAEPDTSLPGLLTRDFDLVIDETFPGHPRPARASEIEHHPLYEDAMRLATPQPVESVAELAEHPWVMEPAGTPARAWATAVCHAAGFEPDVTYVSADMLAHARLVEQGHAVAFLPDMLWYDRTPRLSLDTSAAHVRTVLATVRAGAGEHPLIRTFLAALGYAVGRLPARTG